MNTKMVIELRNEIETEFLQGLLDFEATTGFVVTSIDLRRNDVTRLDSLQRKTLLTAVRISVTLEEGRS